MKMFLDFLVFEAKLIILLFSERLELCQSDVKNWYPNETIGKYKMR